MIKILSVLILSLVSTGVSFLQPAKPYTEVVDQSCTNTTEGMPAGGISQSFIPTYSKLTKINLKISGLVPPSPQEEIAAVITKNGTTVGQKTMNTPSTLQVVTYTFDTPLTMVPGDTYKINLSPGPGDAPNTSISSSASCYGNGQAFMNSTGQNFDIYFVTFGYNEGSTGTTAGQTPTAGTSASTNNSSSTIKKSSPTPTSTITATQTASTTDIASSAPASNEDKSFTDRVLGASASNVTILVLGIIAGLLIIGLAIYEIIKRRKSKTAIPNIKK